jgi:hypothetical protein
MKRAILVACMATGFTLTSNATTLEEMSGTSFTSNRAEQRGNVPVPLLSLAVGAGLLGLGLVAARRVALLTK